jgi:DNA polymerase/3'-5' exonuclease PolX
MELKMAKQKAEEIVYELTPYCKPGFITIAGSIRRERPECKDIDIVLCPDDLWSINMVTRRLAADGRETMNGMWIRRITQKDGTGIDLYMATEATFGTLTLIRTGSVEHNVKLCSLARAKGWQLKASGEGLIDRANGRVLATNEHDIFAALGLPYVEPKDREVEFSKENKNG